MILQNHSDLKSRIKTESERFKNEELETVELLKAYSELLVEYETALRSQICKIQKEIDLVEQTIQLKDLKEV